MMQSLLLVVHVIVAVLVIALVLLQQGKGADAGAAFGSGASSTVFGSRGSGSFLTRATGILATVFFISSLVLAYTAGKVSKKEDISVPEVPAAATTPPAGADDLPDLPSTQPADSAGTPMEGAATDDVPQIPAADSAAPEDAAGAAQGEAQPAEQAAATDPVSDPAEKGIVEDNANGVTPVPEPTTP